MSSDNPRPQKTSGQTVEKVFNLLIDLFVFTWLLIPLSFFAIIKSILPKRKDIRGKLAIVTGGGQGLGRAISLKLADLGCNVLVADLNEENAHAVAEEIKQKGVLSKGYKVDISINEETRKLSEDVKNDFGQVDLLINNAGMVPNMNIDKPGFLDKMVKVNVLGTILMTKAFLKQMRETGGHIIFISSMSALHASPFAVPYSATKAAINAYASGLTEKLRLEKLSEKIKLTCVCPYYICTREDIVEFLNPNIRFPPMDTETATNEIVDAILKNDTFVTVPFYYKFGVKIINLFPLSVQQLARDKILKEYDFKCATKKEE